MDKRLAWLYFLALLILPFVFFAAGTRMELMLGDGDAFVQFMPFWTYAAEQWKNLSAPFWSPHIFGGYPLIAEPQAGIFHPFKIFFFFLSPLAAMNFTVLIYYAIAGLSTFLFAREEGLSSEASLLAGIAFAFCGFLIGHQAITALLITAAGFPLSFLVLRRAFRRSDYSSVLLGAAAIILLVLAGHPQFTFYSLFFGLFYVSYLYFFEAEMQRRAAYAKTVIAMYVLGTTLSAFQLLPSLELVTHSVRDKLTYDDFVAISLPPPTVLTSLISTRLYHIFPNDGSEAMIDVGLMVLLLALIGALFAPRRSKFWIFLTVFAALLFVGDYTPLYKLMFWVPGYNLFRVASRNGIVLDFAIAMLAAYGLDAVQRRGEGEPAAYPYSFVRRALIFLGIPIVYYVGFYLMDERIFDNLFKAGVKYGKALPWTWETIRLHLVPLIPEIGGLLAGGVVLTFLFLRSGGGRLVGLIVVLLALTHFWSYRNWIFAAPAHEVHESLRTKLNLPEEVNSKKKSAEFRIALGTPYSWINFLNAGEGWRKHYVNAGGVDINMLYKIPSISGYTPLIMRDYSRLTGEMHMSGSINDPKFFSSPALNLLNVRYVFVPAPPLGFPEETFSALQKISNSGELTIYRNPKACGSFWGVKQLKFSSFDKFWRETQQPTIDFSQTALLVGKRTNDLPAEFSLPETIRFNRPNSNTMELNVKASKHAFLASSQPAYPGWFAWMDGERIRIHLVNGIFAGIQVPPGTHTIKFRFVPMSFWLGVGVGIMGLATFALVARNDWLKLDSD